MLCSVMIASYGRFDGLVKAIKSLHTTAAGKDWEVLVRFADTDIPSLARLPELAAFGNVRTLVGDRYTGYSSLGLYFTELAALAHGQWVSILDDDMTFQGSGWDEKLKAVGNRAFVTCEFYQLGASCYGRGSCGPTGWFVPNGAWRDCGEPAIGDAPDIWMRDLLVKHHGWPVAYLEGITLNHQWRRLDEEHDSSAKATRNFTCEEVKAIEQAYIIALIRNECRHYMTNDTSEITIDKQMQFFGSLSPQKRAFLFRFKQGLTFVPCGYGILQIREPDIWVTGGLPASHRGHGLGRKLFEHLLRKAPDREITLDVLLNNDRAIALYKKMGFVITSSTDRVHVMRRQPITKQPL